MKNIRSIYSHDPGIRLQDLRVRRVRLNRHLPEAQWIADHRHPHAQILLYLGGTGCQQIGGQPYPIEKGHLFFIPAGVRHSFLEPIGQKPLCLALDFDWKRDAPGGVVVRRLHAMDLGRVRQALSGLTRWRTGHEQIEPGEAAEVLRLLDIFFRALNFLRASSPEPEHSAIFRTAQRALREPAAFGQPLSAVARRIGYQADYLNRTLKRTCGRTLGELRNESRLQKARQLLAGTKAVADVAEETGFNDANYFSRWFREQTGRTPSSWRAGRTGRGGTAG